MSLFSWILCASFDSVTVDISLMRTKQASKIQCWWIWLKRSVLHRCSHQGSLENKSHHFQWFFFHLWRKASHIFPLISHAYSCHPMYSCNFLDIIFPPCFWSPRFSSIRSWAPFRYFFVLCSYKIRSFLSCYRILSIDRYIFLCMMRSFAFVVVFRLLVSAAYVSVGWMHRTKSWGFRCCGSFDLKTSRHYPWVAHPSWVILSIFVSGRLLSNELLCPKYI